MCGIAGLFVGSAHSPGELSAVAKAMAEPLRHRGPDDSGVWADPEGGVAFGFQRLSIFDLSPLGHQPMTSGRGRFVIVFNGEIYNHPELRVELQGVGAEFRSGSDTEVLLGGFEHWGIRRTLERTRGMFAIGVWDVVQRELWLARDRLGIKPLFLYRGKDSIAFASELRSFQAVPGCSLTIDLDSVASFLEFLYVPGPGSIFREVVKVAPGSCVRIPAPDANPVVETFWSLTEAVEKGRGNPFRGSERDAVEAVKGKLTEAVGIRLRADVPVGAFLSGGVDSSVVVALAQETASEPLRTFTVAFDDERFDEGPIAKTIADRLSTRHTEVRLSARDLLELVPRTAGVFDEPFADPSQLPTLLVSEVARRSVTVSLSGDGGDEVFAGYNRYLAGGRAMEVAGAMPSWTRALLAHGFRAVPDRLLERLGGAMARRGGISGQHSAGARREKLIGILHGRTPAERYRALLAVNANVADLCPRGRSLGPALEGAFGTRGLAPLRQMMMADQDGYVEDDLLTKLDRTSMAVSLEARVPLLDHELIEVSWTLPDEVLVRDGRGKWILREILADYLPRSLTERPKMGFSVPLGPWLRGPLREWADDLLAPALVERVGLMSPEAVEREWRAVRSGGGGSPLRVWAMITLHAWWMTWWDGRLGAPRA